MYDITFNRPSAARGEVVYRSPWQEGVEWTFGESHVFTYVHLKWGGGVVTCVHVCQHEGDQELTLDHWQFRVFVDGLAHVNTCAC